MWSQYQLIGSADAQINVVFDSNGMAALHAIMPIVERSEFKVRPIVPEAEHRLAHTGMTDSVPCSSSTHV